MSIPFNKPYSTGKELEYIYQVLSIGKLAGDGSFTKRCHQFFEQKLGFKKVLLTTSCTHALEMAAILLDITAGDEVIMPSYTFVSTANAFVLRGAKIIFADSSATSPNFDVSTIERLITPRTKAIVPVHYAGVACDMERIMAVAEKYSLFVVEDAAQAIDSYCNGQPLGTIGHLAAFSFHETKNIIAGEGGLLAINDERFFSRAEIIREKGTNRAKFFRGEVDKYGWMDVGSSYLPSEIIAAYLYAQLENLDNIQCKRRYLWAEYYANLSRLVNYGIMLPNIESFATNNAHMFYIVCNSLEERTDLIDYLKGFDIQTAFHYSSLHASSYFLGFNDSRNLVNADRYSNCLLRLPLYYELTKEDVDYIAQKIICFYEERDAFNRVHHYQINKDVPELLNLVAKEQLTANNFGLKKTYS